MQMCLFQEYNPRFHPQYPRLCRHSFRERRSRTFCTILWSGCFCDHMTICEEDFWVRRTRRMWKTHFPVNYFNVCVCVLQMELEQCRRSLAEERRARLRAESQLREVLIMPIHQYSQGVLWLALLNHQINTKVWCWFKMNIPETGSDGGYIFNFETSGDKL
jgi:hypothetical protein